MTIKVILTINELNVLYKCILVSLKRIDDWEFHALIGADKEYGFYLETKIKQYIDKNINENNDNSTKLSIDLNENELRAIHSCMRESLINTDQEYYKKIMGNDIVNVYDYTIKIQNIIEENNIDL